MSNTKHTPGPWSVANGLVRSATEAIAKVFGFDTAEKRANAKLIAAAPELLEFAERLDVDDRFLNQFDNMDQLIEQVKSWALKAKAVIKKASE